MAELEVEILKQLLEPGYLYGIGHDGDVYRIEATIPRPGETVYMPPFHMPTADKNPGREVK